MNEHFDQWPAFAIQSTGAGQTSAGWLICAILSCLLPGCGGGDEPPMVTYDPPGPPPGAQVLEVKVESPASGAAPAAIQLPPGVRTQQWLVLQGEADAGDPADPSKLFIAEMVYERQGQRVVAQCATQMGEVSGGKVKYRIEVKSPRVAGRYQVELRQSNGKPESNRLIGQGELQVK